MKSKVFCLSLVSTLALSGCSAIYTQDAYTGEKKINRSVLYGVGAAASCAAVAAAASDDNKGKRARNSALACGALGAGVGYYFDQQEKEYGCRRQYRPF